jgi:flagellar biosynthesis protein FliR
MISFTDTQLLGWLNGFLLPFIRILALMSSAPILSSRSIPVRFRIALSGLIAMMVVLPGGPAPALPASSLPEVGVLAQQILIGLAIGFAARLIFAAFEMAGEIIGLQMGLSYAGFFDPQSGTANAVGRTFSTLALLSFVTLNGPLLLIGVILNSFSVFPIHDSASLAQGAAGGAYPWTLRELVAMGANLFATALGLALPFIALLLLVNLILGVVSRVAPQLNIFAIGFPVTLGSGLILLAAGLPLIETPLNQLTGQFLQLMVR